MPKIMDVDSPAAERVSAQYNTVDWPRQRCEGQN
jgi:hypothetical protein